MFFKRDAARQAVHDAIESARDDITALSRSLHSGPGEQAPADQIAGLLEAAGFAIERDVEGIDGTLRAVREHRDAAAERRGLRHGHVGYLADLPEDPAAWANDGANLAVAATLAASIGLAASLSGRHEHGIVTFMAGAPGWKVAAAAKGLAEPFDAALGVRTAAAGGGYAYTIDNTGDRLGSLDALVSFDGAEAAAACVTLLAATAELNNSLPEPRSIRLVDSTPQTARFEILGASRSELIETAVALKDRADLAVAERDATVELDLGSAIDDMIVNRILIRRVKTYGDTFKLEMDRIVKMPPGPPTDWGNVSYVTPSAEAALRITENPARLGTPDFGALTASDEAHAQAILLGECLAMTGIDVLRDSTYRAIADDQLVQALSARGISRAHRRWTGVHRVKPDPEGSSGKHRRGPQVSDFRMVRGPGLPPPPPPPDDEDEQPEQP
ncbi:MAG TPA: hypothetical protein PKA95_09435 [Thermomicrobiales bacterium]|nr:hypothetical protein [Thermomicrobiales bacterium]